MGPSLILLYSFRQRRICEIASKGKSIPHATGDELIWSNGAMRKVLLRRALSVFPAR